MVSFRKKRRPQSQHLIIDVREVCETTLRVREREWVYREGVIDEATRRALMAKNEEAMLDAIETAFIDYQLGPRLIGYVA